MLQLLQLYYYLGISPQYKSAGPAANTVKVVYKAADVRGRSLTGNFDILQNLTHLNLVKERGVRFY